MRKQGWLVVLSLLFVLVFPAVTASAQGGGLLAFVNGSGQLVVASGDGAYRWIVTNPGETLNGTLGYAWSPQGQRLFFALGEMNDLSLRVGDPASQTAAEIGRAGGQVSGGYWTPDGQYVLLAVDNRLLLYPAAGGAPVEVTTAPDIIRLRSPFDAAGEHPNLARTRAMSSSGDALFMMQGSASVVQPLGGAPVTLPGGDPNGQFSGLWADSAPLVAFWGYSGNSVLVAANAATGASVMLDSGRTAPINPVAWRPGSLQLVYRDATNFVRLTDLSCLTTGCSDNPLERGVELLPASATDIQVEGSYAYYVNGETVNAVDLNCAASGDCAARAVTIGTNVAPQTMMHTAGGRLVYTAYAGDAYNASDREVRALDLGCLPSSCQPQTVAAGAVAGLLSPDGQYVVVEQVGGGLSALRLADGQLTYLSDPAGASLLTRARWAG